MLKLRKKFTNSSLTGWKKDPVDWIMVLEKIRTQLDGMGYVISDKDFMIHTLANLPEEYKSKVKSLESDLDNKDGPLTLDHMLVELDAKYKKICKKNNFDPENKDEKREEKETTIMVQHLQQVEMAYLKADATYVEIGGTKAISVHTETTERLRTDKLHKIYQLQIIL